ncbi:MAG: DUF424 domain-containing protein [Nitrososphaera sp.]
MHKNSALYAARTTPYQGSLMVDICDLDLVGNRLEQDGLVVNLTKEYFQQQVIETSQAGELLQKCAIANLVGERIVAQALSMRMAKEISVKRISGVPFLMIFKFQQQ